MRKELSDAIEPDLAATVDRVTTLSGRVIKGYRTLGNRFQSSLQACVA
jgi:hypothetical protein